MFLRRVFKYFRIFTAAFSRFSNLREKVTLEKVTFHPSPIVSSLCWPAQRANYNWKLN